MHVMDGSYQGVGPHGACVGPDEQVGEACRRLIIEPGHPQSLLYRPGDWQIYQPVFLSGSKIWRFYYSCATFFFWLHEAEHEITRLDLKTLISEAAYLYLRAIFF